jgi:predicted transcriptional regulator of viral defense system
MKLLDVYRKLNHFGQNFLQSSDVASILGVSRAHASKILTRLAESGFAVRLNRGHWALSEKVDPFLIPEFLTSPSPSYISLHSALFFHGMISQIPETIYAVSTARTRKYENPLGVFSIHHIEPEFFYGFKLIEDQSIKVATPEKALLDFFYLSPGKSRLFHSLPEVDLTEKFNFKHAFEMVDKIQSRSRRTIVKQLLQAKVPK